MSTRGAIMAYNDQNVLTGVYHHQDSHPTTLGTHLIELYHLLGKSTDNLINAVIAPNHDWHSIISWNGDNENIIFPSSPMFHYNAKGEASAYRSPSRGLNWWDFGFNSSIQYIFIIEQYRMIVLDGMKYTAADLDNPFRCPLAFGIIDVYYWGWPKDKLYHNSQPEYNSYYLPKGLYVQKHATYMKQPRIVWPFRDLDDVRLSSQNVAPKTDSVPS